MTKHNKFHSFMRILATLAATALLPFQESSGRKFGLMALIRAMMFMVMGILHAAMTGVMLQVFVCLVP